MCVQVHTDEAGGDHSQTSLVPAGAATADHARPVGPKHDRSPEQMQVYTIHIILECSPVYHDVEVVL